MRDRMERFVILPFSVGCVSQSSVAVRDNTQPKKSHGAAEANPSPKASPKGDDFLQGEKARSSFGFLPLPRGNNISAGLQRLVKGFKELFTVFREDDEEEEEVKMEIGFPTDVKHVAHIGWDGTTDVLAPASKGAATWVDVNAGARELLSFPSISFRQFELAMAAQANAPLAAAGALRLA